MSRNILDYPETEAVFPDDRGHALVLSLSLDSLDPFWRKGLPGSAPYLPELRRAARVTLDVRHRTGQGPVADAFLAHLDGRAAEWARDLIARDARIAASTGFGLWQAFFSEARNDPAMLNLARPNAAQRLINSYRDEVAGVAKEVMADLRSHVMAQPLSDWDMEQHTRHGETSHEYGRPNRLAILSALRVLLGNQRFNAWLSARALVLPADEQARLDDAVQCTLAGEGDGDPWLATLPDDDAADIPVAAGLVV